MKFFVKKSNQYKYKTAKALKTLSVVKYLDPLFFELIIDSIGESKSPFLEELRNLSISNKNTILFLIYLNLFSTEKLMIQLKHQLIGRKNNNNLLYSISKNIIPLKLFNKELTLELQKEFFIRIINTTNKPLISQVLNLNNILFSSNLI